MMTDHSQKKSPKNCPTTSDLLALARADFWCFVELMFPVLHPNQKLIGADYLELTATLLMGAEQRVYRRLIFNMPPRHMKSLMISVLYVAWRLGRDPSAQFICISYGDDLAHTHSANTRKIMLDPRYHQIFPGTVLEKSAVDHIRTTKGGYRYATSVGSDVTGFGADEIIIDDPMQPDEATSERAKQQLRDWVSSSVLTRFNDPKNGVLMLVMHRLAPDDLSATLVESADFILKLPLICETYEGFEDEQSGKTTFERHPGDVLNPAWMNPEEVEKLKATLPAHVFASQYQQRPTAGGSGMLSINRFRRYETSQLPQFELIIHSWDIAGTVNGNASVCTKWGLYHEKDYGDVVYLLDVHRLKLQLPEVYAAIKVQDKRDQPSLIIIDERGVGLGVYQWLSAAGYQHVRAGSKRSEPIERAGGSGLQPNGSKIDRFGRAILFIEDGRVVMPVSAPWLDAFLYEVAAFPNISDKDQVDSMTQLVGSLDRAVYLARMFKDRQLR